MFSPSRGRLRRSTGWERRGQMSSTELDNVAPPPKASTSDADYRKLANALPQIIWTCDAQGRLEWVNDRWIGADRPERGRVAHDKGALVAVHPDDREAAAAALGAGARDLDPVRDSSTGSGPGRAPIASTSSRVVPVRDEDGVITRWVAAVLRHARSPRGRGGAARVRATVRDGLSPQSAADRDHPRRRRDVPERQRRVPEADRLLARRGGRQERRCARHLDRGASAPRSSRRFTRRRPREVRDALIGPRTGARSRSLIASARIDFGGEPCLRQRGDRRDRAARHRGRAAAERGAGARARRRARGADGRGAGRRVDLPRPRMPRDARQSSRARAPAQRSGPEPVEDGGRPDGHAALQGVRGRRGGSARGAPAAASCAWRRGAETTKRRSASTTGR